MIVERLIGHRSMSVYSGSVRARIEYVGDLTIGIDRLFEGIQTSGDTLAETRGVIRQNAAGLFRNRLGGRRIELDRSGGRRSRCWSK